MFAFILYYVSWISITWSQPQCFPGNLSVNPTTQAWLIIWFTSEKFWELKDNQGTLKFELMLLGYIP